MRRTDAYTDAGAAGTADADLRIATADSGDAPADLMGLWAEWSQWRV